MNITLKDKNGVILHTANKYCKEDIEVNVKAEKLNIKPNTEEQTFNGLYETVNVDAIQTEELTLEINFNATDTIELTPTTGKYIEKVTVNKDENLVPENILEGSIICGIEGTGKNGTDTTDATATAGDIAQDKTAYINGEKTTGTLPDIKDSKYFSGTEAWDNGMYVTAAGVAKEDIIIRKGTKVGTSTPPSYIRSAINLTASQLVAGQMVLGISGTFSADANATAENILKDKIAYVNGVKVVGTLEIGGGDGDDFEQNYQKVQYIKSNGTQYIDTGVNPTEGVHSAVVNFRLDTQQRFNNQFIFAQHTESGDWNCGGYTNYNSTTGQRWFALDKDNGFSYSSDGYYKNTLGVSVLCPITSNYPMLLFARQNNGQADCLGGNYFELYECKIWENANLIRDFVPCYRKSDSVAGLYDKVNDVFYTNQGTGSFTVGANV